MNIATLFDHKRIVYSLEIFPPKQDTSYNVIYNTLLRLRGLPVDFISVTYGAGGSQAQREKTVEMASLIQSTYRIESVAHLTCVNSTKQDVLDVLDRLRAEGVRNIMVLRGDITPDAPPREDFTYASDLAAFIKAQDPSFNLVGACYPEVHYQAESMDQDIENLKRKLEHGVSHLVTQLFFDNEAFYRFRDKAEAAGITVPIAAGIMPITNMRQIERTVALSGASVPQKLSRLFSRYGKNRKALNDAGIFYATEQIMDLIDHDVRGIHLYTMNNVETAARISENIQHIIQAVNDEG